MGQVVLFLMELFALVTSVHGLIFIYNLDNSLFASMHNCLWFIFGILSNVAGIASILLEVWDNMTTDPSNSTARSLRTLYALQYHYFFAWMDVLVGYAGLVTESWMTYSPVRLSHIHLALVGIPIVAWLKRKSIAIVVTTQVVVVLAILSHVYVTFAGGNWWSMIGAILMGLQIIAMSLPVRFTFFTDNFSTREAAILFSGISSFVFSRGIAEAARYHKTQRFLKRTRAIKI